MTMPAYLSNLTGAAPFAAELALKAALWLGAILLLTAVLRNASAAARHLVCSLGIAGLFAMPFLLNGLPWRITVPLAVAPDAQPAPRNSAVDAPTPSAAPAEANFASASVSQSLGVSRETGRESSRSAATPYPIGTLLLIVWSLGALFLIVRLNRSIAEVRRILRLATDCSD